VSNQCVESAMRHPSSAFSMALNLSSISSRIRGDEVLEVLKFALSAVDARVMVAASVNCVTRQITRRGDGGSVKLR